MKLNVFCMPGRHGGPAVTLDSDGKTETPRAWREVKASYDSKANEWYYNPESGASIWICPHHTLRGEPKWN